MDKRTLLAVVLSIIVLLIYQNFFVKPPVKTEPAPDPFAMPAGQPALGIPDLKPPEIAPPKIEKKK